MRIGIDAKWLFEGPPSGQVVIRNLVQNLTALAAHDRVFLFIDKKFRGAELPIATGNAEIVPVWAGNNMLSNILVLPFAAKRLALDVVLFQNFVPFWRCCGRVGFIHDVLFLSHPQFYTIWERIYFAPLRMLSRRAERLCTVSVAERNRLQHYRFGRHGTVADVIPHGVDDEFVPAERYTPEEREAVRRKHSLPDKYLLFVGRLNVRKNVKNLLLAIARIKHQEMPLVVVGGADWKSFDAPLFAQGLDIRDRLFFTGPVFGRDLRIIYSMATVFCFPSFAESFGLPALEAMACGVSVVVSSTTSLPEVCGAAGNYVNPDDPQEIASMIDRLLDDASYRHSQGELGLAQASKYSWRHSATLLLQSLHSSTTRELDD
jgi:glycosyltransferase involved in cell wall biosynthesis